MRRLRKLLSFLAAAAVVLGLGCMGAHAFRENYTIISGTIQRRDVTKLDLRGASLSRIEAAGELKQLKLLDLRGTGLSAEAYETLAEQLPDCEILWDIPFQGQYLSREAENLTLTALTQEDVAILDHLPRLLYIDARDCEEYALLQQLQRRHPDCIVNYSVTLCGGDWAWDTSELTLENPKVGELTEHLPYLPLVEKLLLTGQLPPVEQLTALQEQYPLIRIGWETELGGVILSSEAVWLDLKDAALESAEQVRMALAYCPALTDVDLRGCSLRDEDMMALADQYPAIRFLWEMEIAGVRIPTDAAEIDISGHAVEDLSEVERALPYFPNLKKVIMCGCGVDNETMDALNRRYEDIRFVWSVYMGPVLLRTDATYFIPVKWGAQVTTEDLYNLRYCTDMLCVDIGHMDVTSCEWAACMPKLKYLLLADTKISDISPVAGLENLIYLELFLTQVRDLSPLVTCTALEDINLCYTYADPAPLLQMPWIQTIWWSGHWQASSLAGQFRQNNPDIKLEFSSLSSTGNGWRELKNYYDMRDLVGMGYMTG